MQIKLNLFALNGILKSKLLQNKLKLIKGKETLNSVPNVLVGRMIDFSVNDIIETSLSR
jgi:hypothetical protein